MRLQLRARQDRLPYEFRRLQSLQFRIFGVTTLQRTTFGEIAFEPGSVNFQPPDVPTTSQSDNRPVISGPAAALCFPAITHVQRASGHDQIVPMPKEHVAA